MKLHAATVEHGEEHPLPARPSDESPVIWHVGPVAAESGTDVELRLWLECTDRLGTSRQSADLDVNVVGAATRADPVTLTVTAVDAGAERALALHGLPGPITVILHLTGSTALARHPSGPPADAAPPATEAALIGPGPEPGIDCSAGASEAASAPAAVDLGSKPRTAPAPGPADTGDRTADADNGRGAVSFSGETPAVAAVRVPARRTGPPWSLWLLVGVLGFVGLTIVVRPRAQEHGSDRAPTTGCNHSEAIQRLRLVDATASSHCNNQAKYAPELAIDGARDTAWNEGAPGEGTGEWITVFLDGICLISRVALVPGYDKTLDDEIGDRWSANNRITRATLEFEDGRRVEGDFDPDLRDLQRVNIDPPARSSWVRITITEVVRGNRSDWHEATVSEIRVWGFPDT